MTPEFLSEMESRGPEGVRKAIASGEFGGSPGTKTRLAVEDWLKAKDSEAAAASSARRDARDEETLSIARHSLALASRANSIAYLAMIVAAIAAITAIAEAIFKKN